MIYLNEIKNRFFLLLVSFLFTFLVCYYYKETLLFIITKPNYSSFIYTNFLYFIFTNVIEIFYIYFDLILFICFQFLTFFFIYHLFIFFSSALFFNEFVFLFFTLKFIVFAWVVFINLLNFWLIPLFWNFFLSFQTNSINPINLHFEAKLSEYISFYISVFYLFLLYFQFFILLFFLFYNLFYRIQLVKRLRKIFYFVYIVFSTIISPPDVFSQILLSFILIVVYEIFFFAAILMLSVKQVAN